MIMKEKAQGRGMNCADENLPKLFFIVFTLLCIQRNTCIQGQWRKKGNIGQTEDVFPMQHSLDLVMSERKFSGDPQLVFFMYSVPQ